MPKATKGDTMTELLRQALIEADNNYAVAKATGVQKTSLIRFRRGEQSLRLDMADRLAAYFGIEHSIRGVR
jgi:plasmid maintenance system antidote protein VapI